MCLTVRKDYGRSHSFKHLAWEAQDLFWTDCFYAAVFEREDPRLKSLPLAVQQKQIIVTCNYEARRRGLYKLQLIHDAKKKCPDVIIVLGISGPDYSKQRGS